jgi:hypothetical protein
MNHSEAAKKMWERSEYREKVLEARKGKLTGNKNPMWGKHHSEKTREKMREAKIGWISPMKGRISSEDTKRKLSDIMKKRWQNPEYRALQSLLGHNRKLTQEHREKIRIAATGRLKSDETRRKISEGHKGKQLSKEHRKKISIAEKGKPKSKQHRKRISQDKKIKWQNPEFAKKMGQAWAIKPNKPETLILNILENFYPGEWKYTGDFSFTINGKCPDFVNCNGQKKCIEFNGTYWHRDDIPGEREKIFAEFGYDTLIIWENEMKNMDLVIKKIHDFVRL